MKLLLPLSLLALGAFSASLPELFDRDISCKAPCDNGNYNGQSPCSTKCNLTPPCVYRQCKNTNDVQPLSLPPSPDPPRRDPR